MSSRIDGRILALIIAFAIIAVVLILFATVFLVRDISVGYSVKGEESVVSRQQIIDASGIKTNKNILFISESEATANIQSKYPQIKVINIERKFPSEVIIYVTVRVPVVKVELDDGLFALLDREMSVVDVMTVDEVSAFETEKNYTLTSVRFTLKSAAVKIGKIVSPSSSPELCVVQNCIMALENLDILNQSFCSFITNVSVEPNDKTLYADGDYVATLKTSDGVDIKISSLSTGSLIAGAYEKYESLSEEQKRGGYIYKKGNDFVHQDYS